MKRLEGSRKKMEMKQNLNMNAGADAATKIVTANAMRGGLNDLHRHHN